jgi:GntR family transcriptional regulator of arabinose operon
MSEQAIHTRKHQLIRQWILSSIKDGTIIPGDKLPSEYELCRRFDTSRGSVRQAIAGLVNDGWVKSQKGIGTFCVLKERQLTMDIGLVCFFSSSYIFPRISRGCDQIAHRRGFHILLTQSEYDLGKEREILLRLAKRKVDGIIIEPVFDGSGPSNGDLLEELDASGTPVILLDNYFPEKPFTRIALDDHSAGRLVASHLHQKGHTGIGILYDNGYLPKRLRMQGALGFLSEARNSPPKEWLLGFEGPVHSGKVQRLLEEFFTSAKELPSAFVCTSDEEAMVLYKAAQARGIRIPQDLSVISFDNSSLADLPGISLTSVEHPGQYMGELATQVLLERLFNPGVACRTTSLITPRLIERDSVRDIQRSR